MDPVSEQAPHPFAMEREAKPSNIKPLIKKEFKPLEVVISGVGPAGLLLAHYLLEKGKGRFRVSLFERRDDPRKIRKSTDTGIRR
jgi:NADPH-dependent 2,4-dienoyl-CoA reductase/sulfur reductase-like enzyme